MRPPRSQLASEEHASHVAHHTQAAEAHEMRGETDAADRHHAAIRAHEAAAGKLLDPKLYGAAMRASAIADEASQRVRR